MRCAARPTSDCQESLSRFVIGSYSVQSCRTEAVGSFTRLKNRPSYASASILCS